MRRAARIDSNHKEVVDALRDVYGVTVQSLASVGGGVPDLLVGAWGENLLLEIKTAKGKLTPEQVKFHRDWRGTVYVVRSADEAVELVREVIRRRRRTTPQNAVVGSIAS